MTWYTSLSSPRPSAPTATSPKSSLLPCRPVPAVLCPAPWTLSLPSSRRASMCGLSATLTPTGTTAPQILLQQIPIVQHLPLPGRSTRLAPLHHVPQFVCQHITELHRLLPQNLRRDHDLSSPDQRAPWQPVGGSAPHKLDIPIQHVQHDPVQSLNAPHPGPICRSQIPLTR